MKARFIADLAQPGQIGLGIGLILALQSLRKRYVFDQALGDQFVQRQLTFALQTTTCIYGRRRHIVEALCLARSQDENARDVGIFQEPEVDAHEILNENEVALLTTIRVAMRSLEQFDLAVFAELVEVV